MIRPKNETEDSLLPITRNCETLIEQTHTRPEETLEFEINKPRETFRFNPHIQIEQDWLVGLLSLEVFNSIFNIKTTNNKLELYTDKFDELSFTELKDELEEIPSISDITPYHLQHEKTGPPIFETYRKLRLEESSTDGKFIIFMSYLWSPIRDFESYLRNVVE